MSTASRKRNLRWRPWLRALHRDCGYFAVGLTFIYALSGLAVNHIETWDPSFRQLDRTYPLPDVTALPQKDAELAQAILGALSITETPTDIYRISEQQLDITLPSSTLHVDLGKASVFQEGQEPRFFLRLANWLHLNRGKKAWTYIADGYAVFLLFLAVSGLFMIPGRKGLLGRGAIITLAGALVPTLYVVLSGGP